MTEPENWSEARIWLRYANEDIQAADELIKSIITPRHICFLAQQATEKAIKAILIFEQISYPKSHDLEALMQYIPTGWKIKNIKPDLSTLSEWAVESRYPGNWPEATLEEARNALETARNIFTAVLCDFEAKGIK